MRKITKTAIAMAVILMLGGVAEASSLLIELAFDWSKFQYSGPIHVFEDKTKGSVPTTSLVLGESADEYFFRRLTFDVLADGCVEYSIPFSGRIIANSSPGQVIAQTPKGSYHIAYAGLSRYEADVTEHRIILPPVLAHNGGSVEWLFDEVLSGKMCFTEGQVGELLFTLTNHAYISTGKVIPEAGTFGLLGLGALGLFFKRKK